MPRGQTRHWGRRDRDSCETLIPSPSSEEEILHMFTFKARTDFRIGGEGGDLSLKMRIVGTPD